MRYINSRFTYLLTYLLTYYYTLYNFRINYFAVSICKAVIKSTDVCLRELFRSTEAPLSLLQDTLSRFRLHYRDADLGIGIWSITSPCQARQAPVNKAVWPDGRVLRQRLLWQGTRSVWPDGHSGLYITWPTRPNCCPPIFHESYYKTGSRCRLRLKIMKIFIHESATSLQRLFCPMWLFWHSVTVWVRVRVRV